MSNYLPLGKTVISLSSGFAFLSKKLKAVLQPFGPFPLAREVSETPSALDPSDLEDRATGRGSCRGRGRADSRGHLRRPLRADPPHAGPTEQVLPAQHRCVVLDAPAPAAPSASTGQAWLLRRSPPPLRTTPRDKHRRPHTERAHTLLWPQVMHSQPPPPGKSGGENGDWL